MRESKPSSQPSCPDLFETHLAPMTAAAAAAVPSRMITLRGTSTAGAVEVTALATEEELRSGIIVASIGDERGKKVFCFVLVVSNPTLTSFFFPDRFSPFFFFPFLII